MRAADARRPQPSHVARSRVEWARRVSIDPTKRGERTSPTKLDLERMFDKLGEQVKGSEERTGDKIERVEAQGNARQAVNVKAQADTAARIDALTEAQARTDRRSEEILATSTRGYRTLEQAQSETKEAFELRLKTLEERAAPEAADIAMHVGKQVVDANRGDNRRIAGIAMVGGGLGGGALIMGALNFIANHTPLVVKVLHVVSLGLVKATGGSYE